MSETIEATTAAIEAQGVAHHQYLLGLELLVAVEAGREVIGDWMFRVFRRQHEEKFLSSFRKLGLEGEPDAVACAKYHVLSNAMGGVPVEYMADTDRKAWVRFRYPRWMYDGPVVCGVPVEASRGFLRGWYAQNGVTLKNPRLGFVCVSEDMTGEFGFCGYFQEYDHDLTDDERLRFAHGERPPPYRAEDQPAPPEEQWSEERLAKANRNYAVEYIRNGLRELTAVIGRDRTLELGRRAARLTGLQHYPRMAAAMGAEDGGPEDAARFLAGMLAGMGDGIEVSGGGGDWTIRQSGIRVARGIEGEDREILLDCWTEIWRGAVHSHRRFMDVEADVGNDSITWRISPL